MHCSSVLCVALVAGTAYAGPIEIIFSEMPGHSTASIPGVLDAAGLPTTSDFKQISDMNFSPDGTQWVIRGRTLLGSDLENIMLAGSGTSGTSFAQEGQPIQGGQAGEEHDFFDGMAGVANNGDFVFGSRARNGDTTVKEKVIKVVGGVHTVVIHESLPANGLLDDPGNPVGDEVFGNSLNSIHLLDDGTVGFAAITLNNIHSSYRPALFYDTDAFMQSHVTTVTDLGGGAQVWDSFDSNDFYTTPDGLHFYAQGDTEHVTSLDDILVVDGSVVVQEGFQIPGTGITAAAIFATRMASDGTWFSRGDDGSDDDWVLRDGALIAQTGDPITPGSAENWGASIGGVNGNTTGGWVIVGETDAVDDATDQVIVFNNAYVIVREGDPIDVDGNGLYDDDVFIGRGTATSSAFQPDDVFLTSDNELYFLCSLRDGAGNDLSDPGNFVGGDAFCHMTARCPGDWNEDSILNTGDFIAFLNDYNAVNNGGAPTFNPPDLAAPLGVLNTADFIAFLNIFNAGCVS